MSAPLLYSAVGARLRWHDVDCTAATLALRGEFVLPEGLQYLWQHASRPFLYAALSDGRPGFAGSRHLACALQMESTGAVRLHGEPIALRARPVHISTDADSRHAIVTFPNPGGLAVHPILADGTLGPEIAQGELPPFRKTVHQALVTPDNRRLVVPVRGDPPEHGRAEEPGSLEIFDLADGRLAHRQHIAPGGGFGFGPRHADFHPTRPWLYLSIERQNEVALFMLGERVDGPLYRSTTLAHPEATKPRQLVGAIHVHPDGRFAYVSNRADGTVEANGKKVFNGGENSIAVFALDPQTGKPTLIQNADTHGMHPRTFTLDPGGRLMVVANMTSREVAAIDGVHHVSGGLSVLRIGDDGRLDFAGKYEADTSKDHLFWVGMARRP